MPEPVDLGYAMRLPPEEAVEYFENKGYTFSWNWHDTLGHAHNKSFTVARVLRQDVLDSIRFQMQRAISKGVSEAEFVRNLEINLKKLGWWGRQVIIDPAGGAEVVQLGSPHRLRTIYRTNMDTSIAHGRYQQQMDNLDNRPYWVYRAILDQHTRPAHAAMNGMVFRADDPIWHSHYPPNGFNCRCYVSALTEAEVEEQGLVIRDSAGHTDSILQDAGIDKRTGEVRQVNGIRFSFSDRAGKSQVMTPDPGWSYNPGITDGIR